MKTLFLLRHAKSSWGDPALDDFDRPLNRRGRDEAPTVGRYLADHGLCPAFILCSAAQRTRETLSLVLPALDGECAVAIERGLYEAGPDRLFARLRRIEPAHASVMVIGHNPGLAELAEDLVARGPDGAVERMKTKFPTGALAVIKLHIGKWEELAAGSGTLERFVVPAHEARE